MHIWDQISECQLKFAHVTIISHIKIEGEAPILHIKKTRGQGRGLSSRVSLETKGQLGQHYELQGSVLNL